MAFWFQCPICTSRRLATDGIIGRRVRCADCSNFVDVGVPAKGSYVEDEEMLRLVDQMITEDALADPAQLAASGLPPAEEVDASLPDELTADALADAGPIEVELVDAGEAESDSNTFDLTSPTVEIIDLQRSERPNRGAREPRKTRAGAGTQPARSKQPTSKQPTSKQPTSKTARPQLQPDDGEIAEPPAFKRKSGREAAEMDMTPMVDVTFLLLIFFMVTASFTMQKSMNRPTETTDDPSLTTEINEEDNLDLVQVDIDEFNSYFVILPEEEPIEAPSEQDLRIALRNAKDGGATGISPTKLLIRAHAESFHEKVVTAMDVGTDLDYQLQVQIIDGDL